MPRVVEVLGRSYPLSRLLPSAEESTITCESVIKKVQTDGH